MIEAARFALFAQTLAPEYGRAQEVIDFDIKSAPKGERGAIGLKKMKARTQLKHLREVLFMDAED